MAAIKKIKQKRLENSKWHLGKYEAIKIKATLNKMLAEKNCISG